ncbi:Swt1 family HEPN domain-containing protein [Namhaeicola litoreus]|uniref:Swt1 family HEPN domain-containing protein n=1 Tax=Namhaeicola litoreus TaxID=1052145 RepID=A0ABW3Y204_9FLAO
MLIGELVKTHVDKIFQYCETKDRDELFHLMDKEYSKRTFNINFPFCKEYNQIVKDDEAVRFWKKDYTIRNKDLRVCSQWIITSKDLFLDYLLEKKIISPNEYNHYQKIVMADPNKRSGSKSNGLKNKTAKPFREILDHITTDEVLKSEALEMSTYYTLFYTLERSIRKMIVEIMEEKYGENWWDKKVDFRVKENVKNNLEYELDTPQTKRSENEIDYSTFGDLRKIINVNWTDFEPKFCKSLKSINETLINLNRLRVPIAHCTPMAPKEVERLKMQLDDWHDALKE